MPHIQCIPLGAGVNKVTYIFSTSRSFATYIYMTEGKMRQTTIESIKRDEPV